MDVIAGVSSIVTLVSTITNLAKQLNEVRESYNSVALNTTLVVSQLSTIKAALEALHDWRTNDQENTDHSKQLDKDLGLSLSCCAILITVIDGKLGESGYTPGMKQKIKYVWLEDILKEYLSNLEGQVRALQLLLTIYQCKTATEQRQRLERAESRRIIENVRAETQTLRTVNKDISDAASVLSLDPSINFDFDAILMKHPAYVNVYGDVSCSYTQCERITTNCFFAQRPLPSIPKAPTQRSPPPVPDRALKPPPVPPRPPPRRRKPVWNPYLGQAVDIGTITRTDSGETGDLINEDNDTKASERDLATEPVPKTVPARSGSPRDIGSAGGQLDGREGAEATEQGIATGKSHEMTPTIAESLGDSENTAHAPPPLVESVPRKIEDREPSPSAADGLRGEMDLAFRVKAQPDDHQRSSSLSSASPKLSTNNLVQTPNFKKDLGAQASSPRSPTGTGAHSRSLSGQTGPTSLFNHAADGHSLHDQPQPKDSPPIDFLAPVESIGGIQPSYPDSDLYSATTRSASPTSVNRDAESSAHSDAPATLRKFATANRAEESVAESPEETTELKDSNSKRSSAVSNYLATNTVFEVLNQDSRPQLSPKRDPISSYPIDLAQNPLEKVISSGLGLEPQITQEPPLSEIIRQNPSTATSSPAKYDMPPLPRRRPPVPPTPPIIAPAMPPPSSPPPPTPTSAITRSDHSSLASPSQRDSSTFNTVSTASSSEFPEVNTAASIQYSNAPTAATSLEIAASASVREQGQIKLRNLQSELAAAKARGDSNSQEQAIQKSIQVIWRTYLEPPTEPPVEVSSPATKSPSPKLRNRASILRLPSINSSSKGISLGNAAAAGDVTTVANLLGDKANINSASQEFKTPLMRAAINGHIDCLAVLKEFGADEFAVDKAGSTVLHHAVVSNNIAVVKWLIDSYPPPPPEPLRHRSSILLRATDVTKWGRAQKNLREASDSGGSKPLHVAVEKDKGGMVGTLLAADVDIEAKNNYGRTPLHQAIITNRKDSFDTLLRNGAKIDALDGGLLSPLHWAARCGQVAMVEALLEKGASRWIYDYAGNLPIHQAAWEGQLPALEAILTERTDLNRVTKFGETLLHISAFRNHQKMAEYLLKNTVDVNPWTTRDTSWNHGPYAKLIGTSLTPLHYACCLGHFEMAYLLLDHEAYVNAPTPDGYTPLMMAVEAGNTDMVSLLHRRGAKVNASLPGNMMTALHMASKRGDIDTVRELCRAGADWKALAGKDSYKRTPASEAELCTDKAKKTAVREYFATIRTNELNKHRYNAAIGPGFGQQQSSTARTTQAALTPAPQPNSYMPRGQQPTQTMQPYPLQQTQSAPGSQWANPGTYLGGIMRPPVGHTQYFDPMAYEAHIDSPPPYQPTSAMSARLAAQPPVHRPNYS